ncbi:unnamed protein product [Paramecium octaurelia]|uniref:Uncharacterized protein n=1 Tax=Paramecium octaurelia TaxID=43137 RepID=A0A8S1WPR4_PAROT|nr:unnamed protein product [Paramecium octaurelia]
MGSSYSKQPSICDQTRIQRDKCIFKNGESNCINEIAQHTSCMKDKGFALKS